MFWKRRVYLDSAAGVAPNPSSPHEEGRRAKRVLEDARTVIARLVEVQADDVIFTSGATEANALAILGHVRALRVLAGPDAPGRNNMHVLYLPSAHASIVENMKVLAEEGVDIEPLPIKDYRVDTDALAKLIRPETVLVSMEAVCGETGVVWNTREVAGVIRAFAGAPKKESAPHGHFHFSKPEYGQEKLVAQAARPILHVDASQAPLTEKITRAHFDADLLTFDAAKVADLHGMGALIAHRTIPLAPLYRGGGQERGLRSGTEAPELAMRFAAALATAVQGRAAFSAHATHARKELTDLLSSVPGVLINQGSAQVPNIVNLSLPGRDTDYLVALLDEEGFAVATRSACETDSEEGSRAVLALTGDTERSRATLRVSWGPGARPRDFARFARSFSQAVAFIDSGGQR